MENVWVHADTFCFIDPFGPAADFYDHLYSLLNVFGVVNAKRLPVGSLFVYTQNRSSGLPGQMSQLLDYIFDKRTVRFSFRTLLAFGRSHTSWKGIPGISPV